MASSAHAKYLSKLPVDWERVPVRALGTVHAGGTPSRDIPRYWNGTIHWVTPAEITKLESKYLSKTNECITYEGLTCCAAKLLPEGSLLVTTRATIGGVAVSKLPVCTNQGFKNIVPNEMSNVDFYYHLFSVIVPELSRLASGSTFPEINQRNFEAIIVPMPSKEEQRHIAEILDTIDETIQKTEALISKLKAMKQGLLHDLLTRGLDENGKLRDPKAHPEHFKDSPLGRIPKEWDVINLGDSFEELYRYPTYYGIEYVGYGVPEVRGELINEDGAMEENAADYRYISRETADRFPRVSLELGDFVMSVRGTMGKIAMVPERLHGAVITANLIRMKFAKSVVVSEWARHFLLSGFFQDALDLATSATTIKTIQVPQLCSIPFRRPFIDEQIRIADVLDTHDSRIRTEEQYRDKLKLQKKGLMHDLLTGKVRVNV